MANFVIIRDLCDLNKITIRELASLIGKNESSIQAMIRSGATNTKTLEDIASILKVSPSVFFEKKADLNINQIGKGNIAAMYGNVAIDGLQKEIEYLKQMIIEKEKIIQDKERTIQILLKKIIN
jgi:transcriptional regulator with XRE-family HTH domain